MMRFMWTQQRLFCLISLGIRSKLKTQSLLSSICVPSIARHEKDYYAAHAGERKEQQGGIVQIHDTIDKTDPKRIHLYQPKYGYRVVPFEWDDLVQIIDVEKDLAKLCRSVECQFRYQIYARSIQTEWQSMYDHILWTKFGLDKEIHPISGLYYVNPSIVAKATQHGEDPLIRVVANDFPYDIANYIEHWVLWKLGGVCTHHDIMQAKDMLSSTIRDAQHCLHWTNPPHLKSMPEIDHVHIVVSRHNSRLTNTE